MKESATNPQCSVEQYGMAIELNFLLLKAKKLKYTLPRRLVWALDQMKIQQLSIAASVIEQAQKMRPDLFGRRKSRTGKSQVT